MLNCEIYHKLSFYPPFNCGLEDSTTPYHSARHQSFISSLFIHHPASTRTSNLLLFPSTFPALQTLLSYNLTTHLIFANMAITNTKNIRVRYSDFTLSKRYENNSTLHMYTAGSLTTASSSEING